MPKKIISKKKTAKGYKPSKDFVISMIAIGILIIGMLAYRFLFQTATIAEIGYGTGEVMPITRTVAPANRISTFTVTGQCNRTANFRTASFTCVTGTLASKQSVTSNCTTVANLFSLAYQKCMAMPVPSMYPKPSPIAPSPSAYIKSPYPYMTTRPTPTPTATATSTPTPTPRVTAVPYPVVNPTQ